MARTRKLISLLLVVMMVVSLFAGLTTTASAADRRKSVEMLNSESTKVADVVYTERDIADRVLTVEIYVDDIMEPVSSVNISKVATGLEFKINHVASILGECYDHTDENCDWVRSTGTLSFDLTKGTAKIKVYYRTTSPNNYNLVEKGMYDGTSNKSSILGIAATSSSSIPPYSRTGTVNVYIDDETAPRESIPVTMLKQSAYFAIDLDLSKYSLTSFQFKGTTSFAKVTDIEKVDDVLYTTLGDFTIDVKLKTESTAILIAAGNVMSNTDDKLALYGVKDGSIKHGGGTVNFYISGCKVSSINNVSLAAQTSKYYVQYDNAQYKLQKVDVSYPTALGTTVDFTMTGETITTVDTTILNDGFTISVYLIPFDSYSIDVTRYVKPATVKPAIASAVTFSWQYNGSSYSFVVDSTMHWNDFGLYLPKSTMVLMTPTMASGWKCIGWSFPQSAGTPASLYDDTGKNVGQWGVPETAVFGVGTEKAYVYAPAGTALTGDLTVQLYGEKSGGTDPQPPATKYSAEYVFVSGTASKALPTEVTSLTKPADATNLDSAPATPTQTYPDVTVSDGKWTFSGWSASNTGTAYTFTGTWTFTEKVVAPASYAYTIDYYYEQSDGTFAKGDSFNGSAAPGNMVITPEVKKAYDKVDYAFDNVNAENVLALDISAVVANNVFKVYYGIDANKNVIPDMYQVTVTYVVSGGKWEDGSTSKSALLTKLNDAGEWSKTGSAALGTTIPAPTPDNASPVSSGWVGTTPTATTKISADTTYIYKYTYSGAPIVIPTTPPIVTPTPTPTEIVEPTAPLDPGPSADPSPVPPTDISDIDTPKTGEDASSSVIWWILFCMSGCGLVVMAMTAPRKREDR